MSDINCIKHLRNEKGLSIEERHAREPAVP